MKVPAWVYVVGIMMVLFGGCGAFSNMTSSAMMSSEFMSEFNKGMDMAKDDMSEEEQEAMEMMGLDNLSMSEEDMQLQTTYRYVGIPLSIIYFLSGLFLLLKKKFALKLTYFTLIISVIITVAKFAGFSASESSILQMAGYFLWAGILFDLTLFIILISVDKTQWKYLTGEYQAPDEGEQTHNYES